MRRNPGFLNFMSRGATIRGMRLVTPENAGPTFAFGVALGGPSSD
jgi:hypothetical protein